VTQSLERLAVASHGLGPADSPGDPDDELLGLLRRKLQSRDGNDFLCSRAYLWKGNERVRNQEGGLAQQSSGVPGDQVEWR
jgi:hypothetical protein